MRAAVVAQNVRDRLDGSCLLVHRCSAVVLVGTASPDSTADVSSTAASPVSWLRDDRRLVIPDRSGNNVLDSITNIVAGSGIGLLFVLTGADEP